MKKVGTRKFKVGISNNPKRRRQQVDEHVKGRVKLLMCRKIVFAERVEKRIHQTFSDSRFVLRNAGANAGRTEWFRLNILEAAAVRFWIYAYWLSPIVLISLLAFFAYYYR